MSDPILPTQFTRESARRIAQVVRSSELTPAPARPLNFERVDFSKARVFRVATFEGDWPIGTDNVVTFKNITNTPNTVNAKNLFFPINFPPSGQRDCAVAKEGTSWYLVDVKLALVPGVSSLSLDSVEVFSGGQTAKINVFPTNATTKITFVSPTSTQQISVVSSITTQSSVINYLSGVDVTLDAQNCDVVVTPETASAELVASVEWATASVVSYSPGATQSAIGFSANATQTATVVQNQTPQNITVVTDMQTAMFVTLDIFE